MKPDIIKKPLNKRITRTTRDKENVPASSRIVEPREKMILSQLREKYDYEIRNIKMEKSSETSNIAGHQLVNISAEVR